MIPSCAIILPCAWWLPIATKIIFKCELRAIVSWNLLIITLDVIRIFWWGKKHFQLANLKSINWWYILWIKDWPVQMKGKVEEVKNAKMIWGNRDHINWSKFFMWVQDTIIYRLVKKSKLWCSFFIFYFLGLTLWQRVFVGNWRGHHTRP